MSTSTWQDIPRSIRGIYVASRIDESNTVYNTGELVELSGAVNRDILLESLRRVYAENEALRAVFRFQPTSNATELGDIVFDDSSVAVQWRALDADEHFVGITCLENIELKTSESILDDVLTWCRKRLEEPLDVFNGKGISSVLLQAGGKTWLFHMVHHLLADGFAAFDLLRRVAELYRQLSAGQNPRVIARSTLADLAEQDRQEEVLYLDDLRAWKQHLDTFDHSSQTSIARSSATAQPSPHRQYRTISVQTQTTLLEEGKKHSVSWPLLATASIGSYLARAAGVDTALCSVPFMNRWGNPGAAIRARTACSAVNLLPVQTQSRGTALEQIQGVKDQFTFIQQHSLVRQEEVNRSLEQLEQALPAAQINVVPFDTVLQWGENLVGRIHNVAAGPVDDITVCVRGMPGRQQEVSLEIDANPALYLEEQTREHADRIAQWIEKWAEQLVSGESIDTLPQATEHELKLLESFNDTAHTVEYISPARCFDQICRKFPDHIALREAAPYGGIEKKTGNRELTYRELQETAQKYALKLSYLGVTCGDRVALRVERGIEQFVLLYALLYLGAVYVPVDPAQPLERVRSMCEDAQVRLLCDGPGVSSLGLEENFRVTSWNELTELLSQEQKDHCLDFPGLEIEPTEEVYILFTSGSTGRPKGVPITAGALHNRIEWQQDVLNLRSKERVLHKTPISFDVHIWELYWPLREGASVVIAAANGHRDPDYLGAVMCDMAIDVLHFVPSMLTAFLNSPATSKRFEKVKPRLRAIICSGEALGAESVNRVHQLLEADIYNLYGPTEAAIDVTLFASPRSENCSEVPIGKPVWNTKTTVRDRAGQLCPVGQIGELHLHGVQVSTGYLNRPELTAEVFYRDENEELSYKTGDLVRWDEQGCLLYVGRADHQVKVRGQRVDLGEIEALLTAHELVSNACLIHCSQGGEALLAFIEPVTADRDEEKLDSLKSYLQQHLPAYMIPRQMIFLDGLPMTTNGKIDRKKLATYRLPLDEKPASGSENLNEQKIVEAFRTIVDVPVDAETDFFAAGGNSLAALELLASLENSWGIRVSLATIFTHSTPRALAQAIGGEQSDDFAPLLPLRKSAGDEPPVIFFPPAGGLGWCYYSFLPYIPAERSVWTVQAPQYESPHAEASTSIHEMAERYFEVLKHEKLALNGAILVGWSLGGMVAFELASLAESHGEKPAHVVLLDAYPQKYWREREEPTGKEVWLAIARMGGVEPEESDLNQHAIISLLQKRGTALGYLSSEHLTTCIDQVRQTMRIIRQGQPSTVQTPTTVVSASGSQELGADARAWEEYDDAVDIIDLQATHIDLIDPKTLEEYAQKVFSQEK